MSSSDSPFVVFLVDDDPSVLKALTRLLRSKGHEVRAFASSTEFLAQHDASVRGCAILDVSMPDLDGLKLQAALMESGTERPVIFVTGVGDIPATVQAMKAGAVDFLTKPVNSGELLGAIERAIERDQKARESQKDLELINSRISALTPREREVLMHVVAGRLNKQIAGDLGIVEKTIKLHRGRMMRKMGVRTVADLVRMAERAGIRPPHKETGRTNRT
jgi:FixJ family two-component response regulator